MAKSESNTPEHPIHLKVAVSREDRNLGPYISYLQNNSNLPLSLNSFVVVVLLNSGNKEVHDQYLAVRPPGLASDVVIYDASNTRRLVTVSMDTVNGQRVRVDVQATYEDLLKFVEPDLVLQYKSMHDLACQQMRAEFLGDTVEDPSDVDLDPVKASLAPPVAVIEDEDLLDEEEEEEVEEFDAFEDVGGGNGPLVAESPTDAADNQFSVEEEELEEDDSVPFDIDDSDVEDEEYHPGPNKVSVQEETATGAVVEEEEEEDVPPFDIDDSDIEEDSSEEASIFADDDSLVSGIYYLDEACTLTCDEDGNPIEVEEEVVEEEVEEVVEEEEEVALYQDDAGQLYLDEAMTQPCDEEGNPVEIEEEILEEVVNDDLAEATDQDFVASLRAMDIDGLRVQAKSFGVNHRFANKCNSPETLINKILEKAQG